jgi:hypothetical protein
MKREGDHAIALLFGQRNEVGEGHQTVRHSAATARDHETPAA